MVECKDGPTSSLPIATLFQSMCLCSFIHRGLESSSPPLEPGLVLGVLARSLQHEEQYRTQVPSYLSAIAKLANMSDTTKAQERLSLIQTRSTVWQMIVVLSH